MKILQFTEEQKGKIIIGGRDAEVISELEKEGHTVYSIVEAMDDYTFSLYNEQTENEIVPLPGDIVIITEQWGQVGPGRKAMIEGKVGQPHSSYMITFDSSAFRNEAVVYCSGGPATFVIAEDLHYGGKIIADFWKWKDVPRTGGGLQYQQEVNLWYWDGKTDSKKALDLFYGK